MIHSSIDCFLPDWHKGFSDEESCMDCALEGILSCKGAKRNHYCIEMLHEFRRGERILHYN